MATTLKALYELNNNYTEEIAANNGAAVGSGQSFPSSAPDPKYGSHYNRQSTATGCWRAPVAVETIMAGLSSWTVQFWHYITAQGAGTQAQTIINRGDTFPWGAYDLYLQLSTSNTANIKRVIIIWGGDYTFTLGSYPSTGWHLWSIEWTGTNYYLYLDGAQVQTRVSSTNVFNGGTTGHLEFGWEFGGNYGVYSLYGLDRLMFAEGNAGGVEISLNPTIVSIAPSTGPSNGGTPVTITGTNFDATTDVLIDGMSLDNVAFVDSTSLTATTISYSPGTYDVTVDKSGNTATLTNGFTYYLYVDLYKPASPYAIKLNGYDVTNYQTTRFLLNEKINVITDYDIATSEVKLEIPRESDNLIIGRAADLITVTKNDTDIYKGTIDYKVIDFKMDKIQIISQPFINLLSKRNDVFAQTSFKNVIEVMRDLLADYLPRYYTVGKFLGLKTRLDGINIFLNTNTEEINIMSYLISLASTFDVGIYLKGLEIFLIDPSIFPPSATDISDYLIEKPVLKERPDLFIDKVKVTYESSVGGGENTVEAGTGEIELVETLSNVYMNSTSAEALAARKLAMYNKYYYETDMLINKNIIIEPGGFIEYDNYIFLITSREEQSTSFKISVIGVEK